MAYSQYLSSKLTLGIILLYLDTADENSEFLPGQFLLKHEFAFFLVMRFPLKYSL